MSSSKVYISVEEKQQVIKWYYGGKTIEEVIEALILNYGRDDISTGTIYYTIRRFEKNGCIHNYCGICNGKVFKPREVSDEDEALEIMVCAAGELELSIRDISLELDMNKSAVHRILKRHGYFGVSMTDIRSNSEKSQIIESDSESTREENKQIIRWYSTGMVLSKIVQLFTANYKRDIKEAKNIVDIVIRRFETFGCTRNCKKCTEAANKSLWQIEDIDIMRNGLMPAEPFLDDADEYQPKRPKLSNVTPDSINEQIKTEEDCNRTLPTLSTAANNGEIKIESPSTLNEEKKNSEKFGNSIEFISVEPTIDIIVVDKKTPNKKRKKREA